MTERIRDYYVGRDIFITGGTGLMGKTLIEKLLRSCPDLNQIFVLIRDSKGKNSNERLQSLKLSKVFDRLRKENPKALNRLVAIPGDMTVIGLGMSDESKKLTKNVSLVFHVAATVRFDEPLKTSIILNVLGTQETLKFATELKNLTRFIHISTAYSYPYMSVIEEKVFPAKADWMVMLKMIEKFDSKTIDALTPKLLKDFPNTYTFTKHLAEHIVEDYGDKIPVCILRPSIVHGCFDEPFEGWYDRILAVMGIITAVNSGVVRSVYSNPSVMLDCILMDVAIKIFVMIPLWIEKFEKPERTPVFHLSSTHVRGYSARAMAKSCCDVAEKYAFNKMLWIPNFGLTSNIYLFYFRAYVFQILPSLILDGLIKLSGRQTFMLRAQRVAMSSQRAVQFFLFNDYAFLTRRFHAVNQFLKKDPDFEIDTPLRMSMYDLTRRSILGCRRYLMKESDKSIPAAVRRFKIIKVIDFIVCKGTQFWLFYWTLYKIGQVFMENSI